MTSGGRRMIKQVVVRTYPSGWTNQTTRLQELLNEGYRVVFATELPKGIIEYIVEKEVEEEKISCTLQEKYEVG